MLKSNGIESKEVQESAGRIWALSMDGLGKIDIYVPENKAEEAKMLLAKPTSY